MSVDHASRLGILVVLLDVRRTELVLNFDIGVSIAACYSVKRIDSDYFEEG